MFVCEGARKRHKRGVEETEIDIDTRERNILLFKSNTICHYLTQAYHFPTRTQHPLSPLDAQHQHQLSSSYN